MWAPHRRDRPRTRQLGVAGYLCKPAGPRQAIERAGTLDRKKVLETISNDGPWQTVVGPVDLKDHIRGKQWGVGQWQNGRFVGISPSDLPGAKPIVFPKPAW